MDKNKKIFLPLTLDSSTKTAFSGKQLFGFLFFGFLFLAAQLLILKLRDTFGIELGGWLGPLTLLAEIVLAYFDIFLIRKIVIKEDKIMQNYQTNKSLQKTELDFMWDIFAVRNNRIRYCSSGMEAVIIRLTHGYLLDRPANQEEMHRAAINNAIGALSKQGYKHIYFNRETKDPNLGPLHETQRKMVKYRDTEFYATATKIIQHTYNICSDIANTEQEYYVIFADTMDQINKLDHVAKEFMHNLESGVYVRVEMLSDEEIWKFFCDLYGLKFIDKARLLNRMFESNKLQLIDIIEVNHKNMTSRSSEPSEFISETETTDSSDIGFEHVVEQEYSSQTDEEDYL